MGAYAFLIETHTQFQPSYDSAVSEATLVWPGILSVLERPISISGHVTDGRTGAPLAGSIDLLNVTFSNGEVNASGGAYGAYHMFLPPGTYDIRFSAPGYTLHQPRHRDRDFRHGDGRAAHPTRACTTPEPPHRRIMPAPMRVESEAPR